MSTDPGQNAVQNAGVERPPELAHVITLPQLVKEKTAKERQRKQSLATPTSVRLTESSEIGLTGRSALKNVDEVCRTGQESATTLLLQVVVDTVMVTR